MLGRRARQPAHCVADNVLPAVAGFVLADTGRLRRAPCLAQSGRRDSGARLANSAWSFVDGTLAERFEKALRADFDSETWDTKYGELRAAGAYRWVGSRMSVMS